MLRKIDFQSGKRLLQSFPYVTLPDSLTNKLRKATLKLAERCHLLYHEIAESHLSSVTTLSPSLFSFKNTK